MGRLLLQRLASTALVVLGVTVLVFLLIHFIPGDPVDVMLGESAQPADRAALRQALGLDQPVRVQLVNHFSSLARLDLGRSLYSQRPITELLAERLPATLQLATAALLVTLILAVPLGLLAAAREHAAAFERFDRTQSAAAAKICAFYRNNLESTER